jgi:hypothetical protein
MIGPLFVLFSFCKQVKNEFRLRSLPFIVAFYHFISLAFFLIRILQFDWQGDLPLSYHQKDLIIYEMHLRGFTKHESSNTQNPGTYIGAISKLDYLKV